MLRATTLSLVTALSLGCAGARGPIYEFRPLAQPLRYEISDHGHVSIETPMGDQQSIDSAKATLRLEVVGSAAGGRAVSVTYEALDIWGGDEYNRQHFDGSPLAGQTFTGSLSEQGLITVESAPEIPAELKPGGDPAALFADILPPLPPGGAGAAAPWPHRGAITSEASMTVTSTYEGQARFAGDTTWNGRAVRVIVSEGISTVSGRGTPASAPGEIVFEFSGKSITRYIWDPERGVMLASSASASGDGELEVLSMQLRMPMTYAGSREVRLSP